jgi:acetyl esterase/lipase
VEAGIDNGNVLGGGDSAGGNTTAALALRSKDQGKPNLKAQILLYLEARLPFDTLAAIENNSGLYLECNGIFGFGDHYLPRAPEKAYPPAHRYVSPGMQEVDDPLALPPAAVFTCGFDPLRDVGLEYASKLQEVGHEMAWKHYPGLAHGFLQIAPWSEEGMGVAGGMAKEMRRLVE